MSNNAESFNCTAAQPAFLDLATGAVSYSVAGLVEYPIVLLILSLMMGLGKGGVPGSSTSSVALNSLLAPVGAGCLDASVAMGVPVTFMVSFFTHPMPTRTCAS